jgi:hypothetical protein
MLNIFQVNFSGRLLHLRQLNESHLQLFMEMDPREEGRGGATCRSVFETTAGARIFKRLWNPGIDSKE